MYLLFYWANVFLKNVFDDIDFFLLQYFLQFVLRLAMKFIKKIVLFLEIWKIIMISIKGINTSGDIDAVRKQTYIR